MSDNPVESTEVEMKEVQTVDVELPTIEEDSTSSDMGSDIPAVIPVVKPKKDVSTINLYTRNSSKAASFYGLSARQSSILGEDPLFEDRDPVAVSAALKRGLTISATGATTISQVEVAPVPLAKRLLTTSSILVMIGVLLGIVIMFIPLDKENPAIQRCAGVLIIMATLWIGEPVPLSVTSLLPVILFPILDILPGKTVASQYFNDVIFLFFAGFLMSMAMEKWNLHRRIALAIMQNFSSPRAMLFGIMCTAAILSVFMSNTSTALMMVSNCNALVESLNERFGKKKVKGFAKSIFLGTAFATSIGGIPTLISSPPNMIFVQAFYGRFGTENTPTLSFSNWLVATLPMSAILLVISWVILCVLFCPSSKQLKIDQTWCKEEYKKLGKISYEELCVGIGFITLSILWLFRVDLVFGENFKIPGWITLFSSTTNITDTTVGMVVVIILFFIPSKKTIKGEPVESRDEEYILTWDTAKKLPWDLIILFGGGFALAKGSEESGLAIWLGSQMSGFGDMHIYLAVFLVQCIMVVMGMFTSNTASANIMLPVVIGVALSSRINPLVLLFPVTCCCSCSFLLPISTPPNLIAFTSNTFTGKDLALSGAILTVFCLIFFELTTFTIFPSVIGFKWDEFPAWAV